jgi:pyridoxal biosynthesis lyase PdxS
MTQELTLITKASTLVVDSKESMIQAATLLGKLKDLKKTTADEEAILSDELAKLDLTKQYDAKREFRLKIEKAVKFISDRVNTYQTAEAKRAAIEAAKITARAEAGTIKLDTAIRKMNEIDQPITKLETADTKATFKTIPKLDITDPMLIPREYLKVDEVAVFAALKAGKTVPGAHIIQVQSITNR